MPDPARRSLDLLIPSFPPPPVDRDDLRQGKPPPAIKHMAHLRKIKVRRPRRHKGKPYKVPGSKGGADRGATTDGEDLEENMTDEEVEVTDEEAEAVTLAEDAGVHDEDEVSSCFGVCEEILRKSRTLAELLNGRRPITYRFARLTGGQT